MPIDYTKRPASEPAPEPAAQPTPPVSGGKVTLTKGAPSVSLTKHGNGARGVLRVNLNWDARPDTGQRKGFFGRGGPKPIDLDLGCLYEFADGSKGVVQALGNAFESRQTFTAERVIWLDGDDRSGANTGGENLFVDLRHAAQIRRVLVYAYIYDGTPDWAGANGVVTLFPASGPQVEVRLDEAGGDARSCAIALLEGNGSDVEVRREVRYVHGAQSDLDKAYGWGMRWAAGRK